MGRQVENRYVWIASDRRDFAFRPSLPAGEILIYVLVALTIVIGIILAEAAPVFLETAYLIEDGILEWLSVALLLGLAALCARRAMRLRSRRPPLFPVSLLGMALAFLFVAGEEISWGQRIFAIETPPWLEKRNQQGEFNVHNLVVGKVSVNHFVFGQLLTLSLAFYMFALPFLARWSSRVSRLVDRLGLPLPTLVQALLFFPAAFLPELLIDSPHADEMVETCGLLMLVAIFLYPRNGHIYAPDRAM